MDLQQGAFPSDAALLTQTTLFQISIFLLDSATLWVMLRAVGQEVSFLMAVPCFAVAEPCDGVTDADKRRVTIRLQS